jgi:hypothetical protein
MVLLTKTETGENSVPPPQRKEYTRMREAVKPVLVGWLVCYQIDSIKISIYSSIEDIILASVGRSKERLLNGTVVKKWLGGVNRKFCDFCIFSALTMKKSTV